MSQLLVDTSVWVAYASHEDANHAKAREIINSQTSPVTIIWPVVWETLNLLVYRRRTLHAVTLGRQFLNGELGLLAVPLPIDSRLALDLVQRFEPLRVSVVDALCRVMARRLNIRKVASFDKHFAIILSDREVIGPQ